jgi:flagellar biosynthetic protein FliR
VIELTLPALAQWLGAWLYPLARIGGFMFIAPVFGMQLVPARIRAGVAILACALLAPLLPAPPALDPLSVPAAVLIATQVLIGFGMGFAMQLFFQVFVFGAQLMAMPMSLGFASMVDPANGVSVTVLAQYFVILLTLVFLATNGHLVMLEVLLESFRFLPVGAATPYADWSWTLATSASWLFLSGLLLALPVVTALLIVNLSFGVMTRAAPQLNIFSLGFPMSMLFGLFIVWASSGNFLPRYDALALEAFALLRHLAGEP